MCAGMFSFRSVGASSSRIMFTGPVRLLRLLPLLLLLLVVVLLLLSCSRLPTPLRNADVAPRHSAALVTPATTLIAVELLLDSLRGYCSRYREGL